MSAPLSDNAIDSVEAIEYTCAMCGGTFEAGWSDEEARAEREHNFGGPVEASDVVVCDPCYREAMRTVGPS